MTKHQIPVNDQISMPNAEDLVRDLFIGHWKSEFHWEIWDLVIGHSKHRRFDYDLPARGSSRTAVSGKESLLCFRYWPPPPRQRTRRCRSPFITTTCCRSCLASSKG